MKSSLTNLVAYGSVNMNRTEYLNTRKGQALRRWQRQFDIVSLKIDQEPNGKKSIKPDDSAYFRETVSKELIRQKRRAFKGDLILEFDFYTTKSNPPAVQSLAKNYLDLLHKEMPHIDNKKAILFKDDDQVKVLISNYHLDRDGDVTPSIYIKAYRLSHFIKDVELTQRIKQDRFTNTESDDDFKSFHELEDDKMDHFEQNPIDELIEFEKENNYDPTFYKIHKYFLLRRAQEHYLNNFLLSHHDLISLYQASFDSNKKYSEDNMFLSLWNNSFNLISITTNLIELGSPPLNSGDSKLFREKLELKLKDFKNRFRLLFPLLHPISVTIFYTPPLRSVLDLDNLARKVIPLLVEIFKPPSDYRSSLSEDIPEQFRKEHNYAQSFPKSGITSYQIIHRKRTDETPDEGIVDFFITDGMYHENNIWQLTNKVIGKWEK